MKAKGLPFSDRMVQEYRADRKDMTRRIIGIPNEAEPSRNARGEIVLSSDNTVFFNWDGAPHINHNVKPRYLPGDLIYVRESWRIGAWEANLYAVAVDYRDEVRREWIHISDAERFERYVGQSIQSAIKAGIKPNWNGEYHWNPGEAPTRWRPTRFMPREVAREFGIIKAVKVERVQEISEADAYREGFRDDGDWSAIDEFFDYFDSLNKSRDPAYSVVANPWVWAYTIERIPMPEGWPNV